MAIFCRTTSTTVPKLSGSHGPDCGSTARRFAVRVPDDAGASDTVAVAVTRSTSWRTFSQSRPEAQETRSVTWFTVECEHLGNSWFVQVHDHHGTERGAGVADEADDVGLLCAYSIAEALEGPADDERP